MKEFDQELYEADDNAKIKVMQWLRSNGYEAWENPDTYGIDILAVRNNKRYEIEVEVKHNWIGPTFLFDTIHYSVRKKKFLASQNLVRFVTLNHERTHAAVVAGEDMIDARIVKKRTKYTSQESFIEVDVSKVKWIQLEST
jgi:hypothetical protein